MLSTLGLAEYGATDLQGIFSVGEVETQKLMIQVAGIQMRHVERIMYLLLVVIVYGAATPLMWPILHGDILHVYLTSWAIPVTLFRWIMRTKHSLSKKREEIEKKKE